MDFTENERNRLSSLFSNQGLKAQLDKKKAREKDDDVLIIDGLNMFIRVFSVNPTMNDDGVHVGGISGFLRSLGSVLKQFRPTRCIVVFDGHGGSQRRRAIYPDYKAKRKNKVRLNRMYEEITNTEVEEEAIKRQLQRLLCYLDCLPINLLSIDQIEADDTISFLTKEVFEKNVNIVSTDKDFLQLVDDRISVWSPTKKKVYDKNAVVEEYGISSSNFVFFRVLNGDDSDNIKGIKGAGPVTIKKAFPFLSEDKRSSISEIISVADNKKSTFKMCEGVLDNKEILERNYKIMQLTEPDFSSLNKIKIRDILEKQQTPNLNRFEFTKLLREDRMFTAIPNHNMWLSEAFGGIDFFVKK